MWVYGTPWPLSCIFCILANHNLPLINLLEIFAPFKSNCCSWKTSILVLDPLFNLYPISTNIQPSSSVIINFSRAEFTDGLQGVDKLPERELGLGGQHNFYYFSKESITPQRTTVLVHYSSVGSNPHIPEKNLIINDDVLSLTESISTHMSSFFSS